MDKIDLEKINQNTIHSVNFKKNLSLNRKISLSKFDKKNEEYPNEIFINLLAKKSYILKNYTFTNMVKIHKPDENEYLDFIYKNICEYFQNKKDYINNLMNLALSNDRKEKDPFKIKKDGRIKRILFSLNLGFLISEEIYHLKLHHIENNEHNKTSKELRVICTIRNNKLEIFAIDLYHLFVISDIEKYKSKFKKVNKYKTNLNSFFELIDKKNLNI
ncbi:MAG: hypothetical protein HPAVJP_5520 [Candidatus Hepatoplasma vulgare]|nr:MAG: hypothetical protein HPAVJP_5520 [Candidatus Hepatoplasma sp.]